MKRELLKDSYALSPMQQGMLFYSVPAHEPGVDIEQILCALHEDLDVHAFERAWQRVVERHAILRTSFHWEGIADPRRDAYPTVTIAVRAVLTGGDKLHRAPGEKFPCAWVNHYGPTGNTVVVTWGVVPPLPRTGDAPPAGRPVSNARVYVLDRRLQPVPIVVPGELHAGGAGLARGYRNRLRLTAEKFIPNPFSHDPEARIYKPGDLVRWLPDGARRSATNASASTTAFSNRAVIRCLRRRSPPACAPNLKFTCRCALCLKDPRLPRLQRGLRAPAGRRLHPTRRSGRGNAGMSGKLSWRFILREAIRTAMNPARCRHNAWASVSDAIACIDYARAKGAHVINASWGNLTFNLQALRDAIAGARDAGIIFSVACGNSRDDNDAEAIYPASYDLDNIIAVAATTRTDGLAEFSNYGATTVDLGAPGSAIFSSWNSSDRAYQFFDGTSMAAANVSGVAALVRARYPNENYRQIINRVLDGVDSLPALSGRCVTGGRLNAQRALGTAPPPGTPAVVVTATDPDAAEEGDTGTFTVSRTGSSASSLTVNYTLGGTAQNGVDYQTLSGAVTIPAGVRPGHCNRDADGRFGG